MGEPLFQARPLIERHQVKVFSSKYAPYGDMSSRVVGYLTEVREKVAPLLQAHFLNQPPAR